ncbi:MAG: sugar phosphate isomerase/epimerase [Armatimonadetes bacterium]|nr:sugar phosphate isomerase/epimerase [Armatimonadota bacterium]
MQPAVITDEVSQDFEHALDVMAEYGVRTAELRGLWGTNIMDLAPASLARARRALRERGMSVCGIASPIYKCDLHPGAATDVKSSLHLATEQGREAQLQLLERAFDLCRYFDTTQVRIFAFWRHEEPTREILAEIEAALHPAVRRAEQAGFTLALENEHACYLGTGAEAASLLARINSPALRCVWDPGNAFMLGEIPYPNGYGAVRPYLQHVHVKDAIRDADGQRRWTIVGEGDIDYAGQFAALARDGYAGYVSLETHYQPPNGDIEAGSRLCLEAMLRLMRTAIA